jgi:hypothetical protein
MRQIVGGAAIILAPIRKARGEFRLDLILRAIRKEYVMAPLAAFPPTRTHWRGVRRCSAFLLQLWVLSAMVCKALADSSSLKFDELMWTRTGWPELMLPFPIGMSCRQHVHQAHL